LNFNLSIPCANPQRLPNRQKDPLIKFKQRVVLYL